MSGQSGFSEKGKHCHSERGFCAKNLSESFVLIEEGFLASPACRRRAHNDNQKDFFRSLFSL
jgi:hypothetical protein